MSKAPCHILAADIGGTHCRLRAARCVDGRCTTLLERKYESHEFSDISALVNGFMAELEQQQLERPRRACLAVAGPVFGNRAQLTNLDWLVDSAQLAQHCGIDSVQLINDFEAVALGIDSLTDDDLLVLQAGTRQTGAAQLVIGAGTGLGVALRTWDGHRYQAVATEAGHADFAPADAAQYELVESLRGRHRRVCNELLLSGNGLLRIYEFECARRHQPPAHRSAAEISAAVSNDAIAAAAVGLFVRIYGTVAGNLALSTGARGGVYIAGGIALHLLEQLRGGSFLETFSNKPPMGELLQSIPVAVVTHPNPGLLGALRCACTAGDD